MKFSDVIQSADWKSEKHVPVIEAPEKVKAGEVFSVTVSVGKEVAHPNTTEHHIRWIKTYFSPDGDAFTYDLGTFTFNAHGEHVSGANEGPVYTRDHAAFQFKTSKSGTLHAIAYCNIHGLWESEKRVEVE